MTLNTTKLKAQKKLKHYVESHEHAIKKKAILIVEHFMGKCYSQKNEWAVLQKQC